MPFPQRKYYRLQTLEKRWAVDRDEIMYAIEEGLLRASIWLNPSWVERGYKERGRLIVEEKELREGLVMVLPKDCRRIFSKGKATTSMFLSLEDENVEMRLSDDAGQSALVITEDDLVVCHQHCREFETTYNLRSDDTQGKVKLIRPKHENAHREERVAFTQDNHYQSVTIHGYQFSLGIIQARIIEHLHEAHQSGEAWVYGKELLNAAGSNGYRLRDVFKSQKDWRRLIESDGRGYYRLNL